MIVQYRKKFLKELARIPSNIRPTIENFVFDELPKQESIKECKKIEKMKGYQKYYKVRFGYYRVGFQLNNGIIIIERVLHRKDIYKFFP